MTTGDDEPPIAVVRSFIAISLVFALVVCAAALRLDDEQLRRASFGGRVASVGAAVALSFSPRTADQARASIMPTTLAPAHGGVKAGASSDARRRRRCPGDRQIAASRSVSGAVRTSR